MCLFIVSRIKTAFIDLNQTVGHSTCFLQGMRTLLRCSILIPGVQFDVVGLPSHASSYHRVPSGLSSAS